MESEDNVAIYPSSHDSTLLLKVYHRVRRYTIGYVGLAHRLQLICIDLKEVDFKYCQTCKVNPPQTGSCKTLLK